MLKGLGFAEAELLVESGYPPRRFILQNRNLGRGLSRGVGNPLENVVDIRSLFRFALPSVMVMIFMGL